MKFQDIYTGEETCNTRIVEIKCVKCNEIVLKELKPNDFDHYNYALTVCSRCIVINYNLSEITRN